MASILAVPECRDGWKRKRFMDIYRKGFMDISKKILIVSSMVEITFKEATGRNLAFESSPLMTILPFKHFLEFSSINGRLQRSLRDDMLRGTGRVVNFQSDIPAVSLQKSKYGDTIKNTIK